MGSTEITGNPKRVVVLDTGELDSVLALGVTPVGAVRADATTGLTPLPGCSLTWRIGPRTYG
jgi:iron complex transport system substrate-binding protein